MIPPTDLDELGTDELHASITDVIRELPEEHPARVLWERLDEILTAGGPECLPAPWDAYSEPERETTEDADRLRTAVADGVGAAISRVHHRGSAADSARPMGNDTLNQPDPAETAELRGAFIDGYTSADINRVFGRLRDIYGQTLLCRWELLDEGWYQGNSEFYFQDGSTYYYDKGIYAWLNGSPDAPGSLGDLAQWRGSPVPATDMEGPQHAVTDDGFHNCALVDKDA